MSDLLNQTVTMTADVTVFTVPVSCYIEIQATSGTVTVQQSLNGGVSYGNSTVTIPNGTTMVFTQMVIQGTMIKVTGGNALLRATRSQ